MIDRFEAIPGRQSKTVDYQPTKSKSSKSFKDQFIEIVEKTDKSIIIFGENYLAYLGEGMNAEDYANATELFMEELQEINKPLEDLKPPEDKKILFNKYKNGYFLVMSVLEENVKLVTEDNPDFDLSADNQEKMSVGLNEIQEVKELLLGKSEPL